MDTFFFKRTEEANRVAAMITPDMFSGHLSGLFMAAPRRTGKSTFLRQDLVPVLEKRGDLVLYVDLWNEKETDPAELITTCIKNAIRKFDNPITKIRNMIPFSRVGAMGVSVDIKSSRSLSGTIPDVLEILSKTAKKNIVFIIDEAQQSLETRSGRSAMYALKSARDAINQNFSEFNLFLVMTGSHQDKLSSLINGRKAPFFGAFIREFPRIDMEFASVAAEKINECLASESQVSVKSVEDAFEAIGRRPEILNECLRGLFSDSETKGDDALRSIVTEKKNSLYQEFISVIEGLPDLHVALLRKINIDGLDFLPFSNETRAALVKLGIDELPSVDLIRDALESLCEKELAWRPSYDKYILANSDIEGALEEYDLSNDYHSSIDSQVDHENPPGF